VTRARVPLVLVTGATGRVGRAVVAQLLGAGVPVRALTRRPAAAGLPAAVEVVAGDLTVPESLDTGLQGVRAVFLVWTAPLTTAPAVIERLIAAAGLASTINRPGMFASNALHWWGAPIRDGDVVRWPYGAAETAPIDERDIASVAARALHEDGHAGGDYVLTGPESLSQAKQVSSIGAAIGRRIRFEELSPEEFRRATLGERSHRLFAMTYVGRFLFAFLFGSVAAFLAWATRKAIARRRLWLDDGVLVEGEIVGFKEKPRASTKAGRVPVAPVVSYRTTGPDSEPSRFTSADASIPNPYVVVRRTPTGTDFGCSTTWEAIAPERWAHTKP
jgi:uncharacterized protein YbjT (DUF2867 family)